MRGSIIKNLTIGLGLLCCMIGVLQAECISGKIMPPGKCTAVSAFSRDMHLETKGEINTNTGEFVVKNLVPGTYDLILTTKDATIEGVNLAIDDYLRSEKPLTEKDKEIISTWITDNFAMGKEFENKGRAIYIQGNGEHVKALVEKLRDRAFHSGRNEVTWRAEIWQFDKHYGTWQKRQRGALTLRRLRMKIPDYEKMTWVFDPKLGGIVVKDGEDVKGFVYEIPKQFTPAMGKVAGKDAYTDWKPKHPE